MTSEKKFSRRSLAALLPAVSMRSVIGSRAQGHASTLHLPTAVPGGVRLSQADRTVDILFPQRDVVSIIKYPDGYSANPYGFFLDPSSKSDGVRFSDRNVSYQDVEVSMPTLDGALTVSWRGRKILTEIGSAPGTEFNLAQDSDLFGLGQFRDPITNFRGRSVYLAQGNSDAVCPLLVSPDGYGILWDTGTDSQFSNKGPYLSFSNPSPVTRYHVLMGDSLESVIARYRDVTGRAPMLPKYAYGFWQSQERYNTQTELTDVLDGYRARSLPLDVMVQDWGYWGEDAQFSGMVWDKTRFPDPAAMSAHVHANNAHLIASVWPAMGPGSSVYMALDEQKLLFKNPHWSGSRSSMSRHRKRRPSTGTTSATGSCRLVLTAYGRTEVNPNLCQRVTDMSRRSPTSATVTVLQVLYATTH